jgi:regulator of sigma E protease
MEGEDESSENPRAFGNAKAWKRLLILVAGAAFNILFGVIMAVILVAQSPVIATTEVAKFDDAAVSVQHGLREGDVIIEANDRAVFTTYDLSYIMATDTDGVMQFVVRRGGEKVQLDNVKFDLTTLENGQRTIKLDFYVVGKENSFINTVTHGVKTSLSYGRVVYMSLFDMLTGRFGLNDMSGPVGVTAVIGTAAKSSLPDLLSIACLIAINLGIMNLLPLPALDGGRVLFVLIEMIFRRPVPEKFEGIIHGVGFALLMVLILIITGNDIYKLITGTMI